MSDAQKRLARPPAPTPRKVELRELIRLGVGAVLLLLFNVIADVIANVIASVFANNAAAIIIRFVIPIGVALALVAFWVKVKAQLWLRVGVSAVAGITFIASLLMALVNPFGGGTQPVVKSSNPYPPYKGDLVMNVVQTAQIPHARYVWESNDDATGACTVDGARYRVVAVASSQGPEHTCTILNSDVRDFTFEANVAFLAQGQAGMLLRGATLSGHSMFYDLTLESYGYVHLYVATPSGGLKLVDEKLAPPNHFDRTLGNVNTLAVTMDGASIDVYVTDLVARN
jgi:hypothetical protein